MCYGMVKDACMKFNISVKHLSKKLLGKKYVGGGEKKRKVELKTPGPKESKKKKPLKSHTALKDPDNSSLSSSSDKEDNGTRQSVKD